MPDSVQPPEATLRSRGGNALEMALLLGSLLLGQGFDAAVVIGYARQDVISNVQASQRCPAPAVKRRLEIQRQVQEFLAGCSGSDVAAAAQRQSSSAQGTPSQRPPHADHSSEACDPVADGVAAENGAAATAAAVGDAVQSEAAAPSGAAAVADVPRTADAAATGPADTPAHEQQTPAESTGQAADGEAEVSTPVQAVAPQQDGGSSPQGANPYRLHAWVLLNRQVSGQQTNPCCCHACHATTMKRQQSLRIVTCNHAMFFAA